MTPFEQVVWSQWKGRGELAPPASCVSAALGAFVTLLQQEPQTQEHVGFVFRLAAWRTEIAASVINTHVQPVVVEGTEVRATVSAAEWQTISGVPHLRIHSPDLPAKPWETYRARARQFYDVPHAKRLTPGDHEFLRFLEPYKPLPEGYICTVWEPIWTKWREEHREPSYKEPAHMYKRYLRLQKRLQRRQRNEGI